jgi:hypothetical protein
MPSSEAVEWLIFRGKVAVVCGHSVHVDVGITAQCLKLTAKAFSSASPAFITCHLATESEVAVCYAFGISGEMITGGFYFSCTSEITFFGGADCDDTEKIITY